MKPVSPIIPGVDLPETVYAKDQSEYNPLPVWRDEDGTVLSRWHCDWRERLRILTTGDVYLWQMTFNQPLQPVVMQADRPWPGSERNRLEFLWGKHKENGFWVARGSQWRVLLWTRDTAAYIALGPFRLRIMKRWGQPVPLAQK